MKKSQEFNKITVALVCHNEKEQLGLILQDIKNQSFLKHIKEVLVLQTPHFKEEHCKKTREIAESFKKKLPLIFMSSKKNHLGLARHKIIERAESKWVAFTDSDCRLKEDWLESFVKNVQERKHLNEKKIKKSVKKATQLSKQKKTLTKIFYYKKPLKPKKIIAVGGPNRLPEDKFWKKMLNLSLDFAIGHGFSPQAWMPDQAASVSHIPTTNGLFLKSAVLKAGGFSSHFPYVGEDLEMGKRLKKQGELLLLPKPLVINNYAFSYLESLKRLFTFGLAQNKNKGLLFYLSLLFFPLFIGGIFFLSFFWLANSAPLLSSYSIFNSPSAPSAKALELSLPLIFFAGGAFFFFSFYFLILLVYSLKACIKVRSLSPLTLIFFWTLQHLAYTSGAVGGFLINRK